MFYKPRKITSCERLKLVHNQKSSSFKRMNGLIQLCNAWLTSLPEDRNNHMSFHTRYPEPNFPEIHQIINNILVKKIFFLFTITCNFRALIRFL